MQGIANTFLAHSLYNFIQYRVLIIPMLAYFLVKGKSIGTLLVYSSHPSYFSIFFSSNGVDILINTVLIKIGEMINNR